MHYHRMPIEIESPEEMGYDTIRYNLAESSVRDRALHELNIDLSNIVLAYGEHRGITPLRDIETTDLADLTDLTQIFLNFTKLLFSNLKFYFK